MAATKHVGINEGWDSSIPGCRYTTSAPSKHQCDWCPRGWESTQNLVDAQTQHKSWHLFSHILQQHARIWCFWKLASKTRTQPPGNTLIFFFFFNVCINWHLFLPQNNLWGTVICGMMLTSIIKSWKLLVTLQEKIKWHTVCMKKQKHSDCSYLL